MNDELKSLVQEFEELDKDLLERFGNAFLKNQNQSSREQLFAEIFQPVVDIVLKIQMLLAAAPILTVDDANLRKAIKRIRNYEYYNFFEVYKKSEDIIPEDYNKHILPYDQDIHMQISPLELFNNKLYISTIIISQSVPESIQTQFSKIKECFCFNFDEAAAIWCRSLLEECLKEILKKKGAFKSTQKIQYLREMNLVGLINVCKDYFDYNMIKKMNFIRRQVNNILHASRRTNTYEIISSTFSVIENIFEN